MPLPQSVGDRARRYTDNQFILAREAGKMVDRISGRAGDPERWRSAVARTAPSLLSLQQAGAALATPYVADALVAQGARADFDARVQSAALVDGTDGGGSWTRNLVYAPLSAHRRAISQGRGASSAITRARFVARAVVLSGMRDMARSALTTAMYVSPDVTWYVRVLRGVSCARCAVLAGRKYRVSAFRRHPRCDCSMAPSVGDADGWATDPGEYFDSLDPGTQDRLFTADGARAIRSGADISRVVNARAGVTTVSGARKGRLLPDGIFQLAESESWSREKTLDALSRSGYIT